MPTFVRFGRAPWKSPHRAPARRTRRQTGLLDAPDAPYADGRLSSPPGSGAIRSGRRAFAPTSEHYCIGPINFAISLALSPIMPPMGESGERREHRYPVDTLGDWPSIRPARFRRHSTPARASFSPNFVHFRRPRWKYGPPTDQSTVSRIRRPPAILDTS